MRALALLILVTACGSDLGRLCDGKNGDTTSCGGGLSCTSAQGVYAQTSDGTQFCDTFRVCSKSCNNDGDCLIVNGVCGAATTCNGKHNLCTTRP